MILDEGTNQLDVENESKIMSLLLEHKKEKIILMISHRMTTLQKADYLYCLEEGIITDQGTPGALRKKDSLYARFWKEQVEYFRQDVSENVTQRKEECTSIEGKTSEGGYFCRKDAGGK
jgi:ABC-type transport system involved in cytochrome bd biosynthesis fused ATPase/permease subunit